jgi:UDP-N-acetylbacillosamine N-acetyltransferase
MKKKLTIIGYSGHSYVIIDEAKLIGIEVNSYFDKNEKALNPYSLKYLGEEHAEIQDYDLFLSIGDNSIRENLYNQFIKKNNLETRIISKHSYVSDSCLVGQQTFIGPGAIINSRTIIDNACILNTGCVVEHECVIGKFSHIAPGAVLCGGVTIGKKSLIGANATILPGINIGDNVIIGAGSVVTKDICSNTKYAGNPVREL